MSELTDAIDRQAPSVYRVKQGGTKRFHVYATKMTKYRLRNTVKIHTAVTRAAAHRFLSKLVNPVEKKHGKTTKPTTDSHKKS